MNVWKFVFELEWSYSEKGDFDTDSPEEVKVAAGSYESALAEARLVAMADFFEDKDADVTHTVTDARIVSVKRGISIDAIAAAKPA